MTTISTIKKLAATIAIAGSLGLAALSLGTAVAAAAPSTDSGSSTSSASGTTSESGTTTTSGTIPTSGPTGPNPLGADWNDPIGSD